MNVASSWELKGRREGRAEEALALVLRQLRKRFALQNSDPRLTNLSLEQLEQLSEDLLDFDSAADLDSWLAKIKN